MAGTNLAPQINCKTASEVRNAAVSFADLLASGETLTGTPTVTQASLTFANQAVSTAALTINGETVAIGKAVQFKVSGGAAGNVYEIDINCDTTSTPVQTLYGTVTLEVVAN
jgi:hypothetical protein